MIQAGSAFGDLLREFRVRAGLSQSDLAEKANISEAAIGALERGVRKAPYRSTVALLANALALTASETAALESARIAARRPRIDADTHNIETERTPLVGREADVEHVLKLLHRSRMITVTGSGGVGKTRLALESGRRLLGQPFPEVWFVELGPLIDGDFIAAKIAQSIRPPLTDRVDSLPALVSALEKRHMLLILDNCEHLETEAACTADAILGHCRHIAILATSRGRLNVDGEFVYRLPSLLLEPAVELFTQRVKAVDSRFSIDAKAIPIVTDIARRLGGIPLALELTAAQVPLLGLDVLYARLGNHLNLPSDRRDLPARQQTVTATIEWSYNLLAAQERALLCAVSVFAGAFRLAGAQAVCSEDALRGSQVPTLLSSLVDRSLISSENGERFSLLETVRSFGIEKLRESGDFDGARRRHARWFAAIADDVENTVSMLLPERAADLMPEFDDVRAAVSWSLHAPDGDDRALAGHILSGLFGLWDRMGGRREHFAQIQRALDCIDEERHPLVVAYLLRDFMLRTQALRVALEPVERAIRVCERSGDRIALAKIHNVVSQVQAVHGMLEEAERSAIAAHDLLIATGMENSTSFCANLLSRSYIHFVQGRLDEARAEIASAEAIALSLGHRYTVLRHYYIRKADIEYVAGNKQLALDLVQGMIDSEFGSDPAVAALALPRIVALRLLSGDVEGAIPQLRELLALVHNGYGHSTYMELEHAALALALLGKPLVAAKLLKLVRSHEELAQFRRLPMRQDAYDLLCSTLRKQLGDENFDRGVVHGKVVSPDEAVDEALAAL